MRRLGSVLLVAGFSTVSGLVISAAETLATFFDLAGVAFLTAGVLVFLGAAFALAVGAVLATLAAGAALADLFTALEVTVEAGTTAADFAGFFFLVTVLAALAGFFGAATFGTLTLGFAAGFLGDGLDEGMEC